MPPIARMCQKVSPARGLLALRLYKSQHRSKILIEIHKDWSRFVHFNLLFGLRSSSIHVSCLGHGDRGSWSFVAAISKNIIQLSR